MTSEKQQAYRVLARKYRPRNFDELIGQEALVRTLKNAIGSGRIAHAFMLTGVRGIGKTTTARIIAKALNYKGPDGTSGPTTGPTDDCPLCRAITEDRHPDVIEMDAASHTGVDNMRDILDGVRYAPVEARYKIYIIDEVHMLSASAFNALLKTLEEPPEHVKFIFATTEIRKVPVTVLSRCQRFDLRRVSFETLCAHYKDICAKENFTAEDTAIEMIARAADGSVRDGLSLLDQAMALSGENVTGELVQSMLGLTDRLITLDLLENILTGKLPEALKLMDDIYRKGGAPIVIMQDLLGFTHLLTKFRAVPEMGNASETLSGLMLERIKDLANRLTMPTLGKTWQILLKGLSEVHEAPNPQASAEMVLIRLTYAADLPDPADLIRSLKDGQAPASKTSAAPQIPEKATEPVATHTLKTQPHGSQDQTTSIETLQEMIALLETNREARTAGELYQYAHLVKLEYKTEGENPIGHLEFRLKPEASPKLAQSLGKTLQEITGQRWLISLSEKPGQPTLAEQKERAEIKEIQEASRHPVVMDILKIFPDARIIRVEKALEDQDNASENSNTRQSKEKTGS
ncbi:MAG: DNA polymerase III subunit gamma/tau [Alphaproteobacteria bacterium]|nr:DNA polymerase III subunit gamma/tau [Alphaproteobacteria bacterium]MBP7758665.1 DNA polymerase III subunit gamma/tau [Alphaproteobacteria bacterium]MBP7761693.1 DNA polymerase III subunit gamma/tau [Alphaproteobacteria bacterium]MBP7903972.1 DNA polymerase III subunit gamma/tau [Alphaproteobacteria bacterium]